MFEYIEDQFERSKCGKLDAGINLVQSLICSIVQIGHIENPDQVNGDYCVCIRDVGRKKRKNGKE